MATINDLHRSHTGKSSDKWASYLTVYDRIFKPYMDDPVKLLEVGVQNGGSLEVWSKYFSSAEIFVGCDIDPKCGNLAYNDKRISLVVGDVRTVTTINEIRTLSSTYDIIIDDGSHLSGDIIRTFINYFQILDPGGIYVVEDTHTMYWDDYQGGIMRQATAHGFFRLFVDLINYEFWKDDLSLNDLFATFFPSGSMPSFMIEGWVEGIEFYNSMVIIRKSKLPSHSKLGERLIVGNEAIVEPGNLEL